jgi:hypothetical protein
VFNGGPGERRSVSSLGMGLGWGQAVVASTLGDTRRGDGSFLWGLKRKKKRVGVGFVSRGQRTCGGGLT